MFWKRIRRKRRRRAYQQPSPNLAIDALEPRNLLAGTPELIQLDTETDSFPADFIEIDGTVFFIAEQEERGLELWKTDGTPGATQLVRDIFEGPDSSNPQSLIELNGKLFFSADDGINGRELWMSDGTESGTVMVKNINEGDDYDSSNPSYLLNANGKLFFAADDGENGIELWMSDGTTAGTVIVKDIAPGESAYGDYPNSSVPSRLTNVDGTLFFAANDGMNGQELWKSDGTESGTVMVRDINPGEGYQYPYGYGAFQSLPKELTNVNGTLFFVATAEDGEELWMSDGTREGTMMVENLHEGSFSNEYGTYPYSSYPSSLTTVGGTLYFSALSAETGFELWKYEGAESGIELVRDIAPGDEGSLYDPVMVASNGFLYFTADDDDSGNELWRTDGTEAGTMLIRDIDDGPAGSDPLSLADVNGIVYFSAGTSATGIELWQTDGSMDGTFEVADLHEGEDDSSPNELFNFDGTLLFSADDGGLGFQLWTLDTAPETGFVEGVKFQDLNLDGVRNEGEPVIANALVFADRNLDGVLNENEVSAMTDAEGRFRLEVVVGDFTLISEPSQDRIQTWPISSRGGHSVSLTSDEVQDGLDFAEADVPAPLDLDLISDSDSGAADDDNITRLNNSDPSNVLRFRLNGIINTAEVRVLADGVLVGTTTADSNEIVIATDATITIPDGAYSFTAIQTFDGITSAESTALQVVIDTLGPAAISSDPPSVTNFDEPFVFDIESADEGLPGVGYTLSDAPDGLTIDGDGSLRWTPTEDQARPHDFSVNVVDAAGNRTSSPVELTVLGNIAALPDEYTTSEDTDLVRDRNDGLLSNDGDGSTEQLAAEVVEGPDHGRLQFNDDGSFRYIPDANFSGVDQFTYRATDGNEQSNIARVTINITSVNDPPSGKSDLYETDEDVPLNVSAENGVLRNDTDVDGDAIVATIVVDVENGSLTLNSDGSFVYTPNADFHGTDVFSYRVGDSSDTSDPISVLLTVVQVEDTPVGTTDSYNAEEDSQLVINANDGVLANDSDAEDDQLIAEIRTATANGMLDLRDDGSFVYTPNDNFFGVDTFTYAAVDDDGASEDVVVRLTVLGVPDPPTAVDDEGTVSNDASLPSIDVLDNDTAGPGEDSELTVMSVTQGTQGGEVNIVRDAVLPDTISYTPPAGFVGTDTFTYEIEDANGLVRSATVTIDVTGTVNDNSLSGLVYIDLDEDGEHDAGEPGVPGALMTLTGTDLAGNPVNQTTITAGDGVYRFIDLPAGTYQITENQPHALVDGEDRAEAANALVGNDQISSISLSGGQEVANNHFGELRITSQFVSIAWFFASSIGSDDVFRETIAKGEEGAGNLDLANAIRNRQTELDGDINRSPIAVTDSYATSVGEELNIDTAEGLLANDVDPDGDPLTLNLDSDPLNGQVTLRDDGAFDYIPDSGFTGSDSFTYTIEDSNGNSSSTEVTIQVEAITNDFSVIENGEAGTNVGTVSASAELGTEVAFEIENSNTPDQFALRPDDHFTGNTSAPIVLVEYLDYQCPTCRRFHPIIEQLEEEFPDELLVVTRHLPLNSVHPNALQAAIAAEAAGRQGAFDEMGDLLFENQSDWEDESNPQTFFDEYAGTLGLDLAQFTSDMSDPVLEARVNRDLAVADDIGATGTPTFYLNGRQVTLPNSENEFVEIIEEELDDFDEPLGIDRLSGELFLTGFSRLNFESNSEVDVRVRASTADGETELIEITVNVEDVNEAPIALADSLTTAEDQPLVLNAADGVLANDFDEEGDILSASVQSSPANGELDLRTDGSLTYIPDAGFTGTDSFTYLASDDELSSNLATVSITVEDNGEGESEDEDISAELLTDLALANWP